MPRPAGGLRVERGRRPLDTVDDAVQATAEGEIQVDETGVEQQGQRLERRVVRADRHDNDGDTVLDGCHHHHAVADLVTAGAVDVVVVDAAVTGDGAHQGIGHLIGEAGRGHVLGHDIVHYLLGTGRPRRRGQVADQDGASAEVDIPEARGREGELECRRTLFHRGAAEHRGDTGEGYVSIGRALDNTTLFVLNQKLMPVPVGIAGELYIGGDGVSTGYLNLPGMTSDRFIQDPFSKDHGSRIYKTGDVVQYLPDGNLIYLNRADNQVKIRGFRIEPGEIESVIAKYEGVKENVVITRVDGHGEKILAAYCVTDKNPGFNETELRSI